jgi:hypothetical protein
MMKALLISRDSQLYAEIASQGAARVPPLNVAASRASLRDALDRPLAERPAWSSSMPATARRRRPAGAPDPPLRGRAFHAADR